MILCAIAAMARNRVIGNENRLPWHIPEDLKWFKEKTLGAKLIMGRKTFESLGKALPKRTNIVLTRDKSFSAPNVEVFSDLNAALARCEADSKRDEEVFITGGGEIYRLALPKTQKLYLTVIDQDFEGDATFPEVDLIKEFKIIEKRDFHSPVNFSIITAVRSSN